MRILLIREGASESDTDSERGLLPSFLMAAGHEVSITEIEPAGKQSRGLRMVKALHGISRLPIADVVLADCSDVTSTTASYLVRSISEAGERPVCIRWLRHAGALSQLSVSNFGGAIAFGRTSLLAADAVLVPGEQARREVLRRMGSRAGGRNVHVCWPGYARGKQSGGRAGLRATLGLQDHFVVVHHKTNSHGLDRVALSQAIEVTRTDPMIRWILPESAESIAAAKESDKVIQLRAGQYSDEELFSLADVNLLSESPEIHHCDGPGDLLPLLAEQKPVIAVCKTDGDWADVLNTCHAGQAIPSGHGEMLARTLWKLRDSKTQQQVLGQSARSAYDSRFTPTAACKRIESVLSGEHSRYWSRLDRRVGDQAQAVKGTT